MTGILSRKDRANIDALQQSAIVSTGIGRKARAMATDRVYSASQVVALTCTMHEMRQAPGPFEAVQIRVHGYTTANTIEVGVAAPAQFGDGATPLDAAGSPILPTQASFGSTDINDISNPGAAAVGTASVATTVLTVTAVASGAFAVGQLLEMDGLAPNTFISSLGTGSGGTGTYNLSVTQATLTANLVKARGVLGTISNQTGSIAAKNLTEGYCDFDWVKLPSLARSDFPSKNPLLSIRVYGIQPPGWNQAESSTANANPFSRAMDGEYKSGYWVAKNVITNNGGAISQQWMPSVSVRYLLRGQRMITVGCASDSLKQGDTPGTATPWGGTIDGWPRKFVRLLNAAGTPACYYSMAKTGSASFLFHAAARQAILGRRVTHLFLSPWSVNDNSLGDAGVTAALQRTTELIGIADLNNVEIILLRPGAMGAGNEARNNVVRAYCDQARAQGIAVFDEDAVITLPGSPGVIRPEYVSDVDALHLNEAGHIAESIAAFNQRASFRI